MKLARTSLLVAFGAFGALSAHATWFTSESAFLAAINPSFYLEDYSSFTFGTPLNGSQTSWVAPGANGYGFTASAANGLYSNSSALSTNTAADPLVLTFSGKPVTAFAGKFADTDISGNKIAGTSTVLLSNGDTQSINNAAGQEVFLGWVGTSAVTSASITATSGAANNWPQIDHTYVGAAAVPEPMTMIGLAAGAAVLARRRRKA